MSTLRNKYDGIFIKIIDAVFRPMKKGKLSIYLPDGSKLVYGEDVDGIEASIQVQDMRFFKDCVLYGAVGFGESFVKGDWVTDDLTDVISWMIDNYENHPTMGNKLFTKCLVNVLNGINVLRAKFKVNSIRGSQRNIMDHYDLGNDFFETFLDSTMAYSAAYFSNESKTLEEAQVQKFDRLCQKLQLKPTDHLLEIGTGWGGFAVYAAEKYGCKITTTTISKEQYDYAKNRILENRLEEQIDVQLCDYRHLKGKYDKIVSIEMIEAVGHKYLETYFQQCHNLLNSDGLLALQMIQFPDHRYDDSRKKIDWIQKYIFPGSLLPSQEAVRKAMKKTGTLELYDYKDITAHYAKTLHIWRERFMENIHQVGLMGKDDDFQKKWFYYFSYCEAAFKMRYISVAQVVYTRSNNSKLHDPLEFELSYQDQKVLEEIDQRQYSNSEAK